MKWLLGFSVALSLFVLAPLTFMTFDTLPPYEYDVANSYIIPQKTRVGHQVTVHWRLARVNRVCPGSIVRNIVDASTGVRITYDPVPAAQGVIKGDDELNITFPLPQQIALGKKFYYADGIYGCNLLQKYWKPLIVRTPTLVFEIVSE